MRRKRSSEASDDDSYTAGRKRRRLSEYAGIDIGDVSFQEAGGSRQVRRGPRTYPNASEELDGSSEIMTDNESPSTEVTRAIRQSDDEAEDDDDSEGDDMSADQLAVHHRSGHAFSGVLESVRLDRFMSHECFEYKLGPNVNIINGPNGSGKSAIVAAVQIGLGARATSTERAARVDDHIMYGKSSAVITIKIRNRIDPSELSATAERQSKESGASQISQQVDSSTYKHPIYGDAIIIERTLQRGGQGRWMVKDKSGRSVLSKLEGVTARAEVQNICDHFGLVVDNPVAVLTQTATKQFLAQCKPRHHYELFQRATRLGPLSDQLQATQEVCKSVNLILQQKRKSVPGVQQQLAELKAASENCKEMKHMAASIHEDSVALAWCHVDEISVVLSEWEEQTKTEFEGALTATLKKEAKIMDSIESASRGLTAAESAAKESSAKAAIARKNLQDATKQHEVRKREVGRKKHEVEQLKSELRLKEAMALEAEQRLEAARSAHVMGQTQKSQLIEDLENVKQELGRAVQCVSDTESRARDAEEAYESLKSCSAKLDAKLRELVEAHDQKRRQAAEQRRFLSNANHVGRFGTGLARVMPRIEQFLREGRFHQAPVGPVGQYISVKDDFWACTIQEAIQFGNLTTFLVGDRHDLNLLKECFHLEKAGTPRIIVVTGGLGQRRHRLSPQMLPQVEHLGHCTVLDMLEIRDDDVFNMLVDHCRIEVNVLVRGTKAMTDLSHEGHVNVAVWWDEQGNRAYTRNRSHAFRPSDRRSGGSVLSRNRMAHVEALEEAAHELGEERARAGEELDRCMKDVRMKHGLARDAVQDVQRARKRQSRADSKKEELELRVSEAASEFDSSAFDADIENCRRELDELKKELDVAVKGIDALVKEAESSSTLRSSAQQEFDSIKREVNQCRESLETLGQSMAKDKAALRRITADKVKQQSIVERAHQELTAKRSEYTKALEDARKLKDERPRKERGMTVKKYEERIRSNKKRLADEESRRDGKCAHAIEEEYLNASMKFEENQALMGRIEAYAEALDKGLTRRIKEKKCLHALLRKQVRTHFNLFLSTKGHRGSLSFSRNENGKMELRIALHMATHKTGDGDLYKTEDLKSLSGGERSYATLSFMMALADVTQNPVRIMDEPDVFMDEASRNAAFGSLIELCTSKLADRQVVLVTPLTLPKNVKTTDSVRVVRLNPIVRGRGNNTQAQARIDDYVGS